MMQPSAGSQASQQQPQQKKTAGKKFLDKYAAEDGPLSQYIASASQQLIDQRNPTQFQQTANGAIPQTIAYNKDYYA